MKYNAMQYNTIRLKISRQLPEIAGSWSQIDTIQYSTIQYDTIQYNITQYNTKVPDNSQKVEKADPQPD